MAKDSHNGWDEWGKHVLAELGRLKEEVRGMRKEQSSILQQLATLKVKSGVWGAMGACVPIALLLLISWAKG